MQKEDGIGWLPLTSSEQHTLNERWPKLWPSNALSIQAAVKVLKREGFDAIHRSAYKMAMRTQTMPINYWPADWGVEDAPAHSVRLHKSQRVLMPTRLERLQVKEAQVKAQIQQVLAVQKAAERKKETRRKFLIGDAVLAQVRSGELVDFDLALVMDRFLIHPNDRALFDLGPLPVEKADSEVADKENTDIEVDADAQRNALADDPLEPVEPPSIPPAAKTKAETKKGSAARKKTIARSL